MDVLYNRYTVVADFLSFPFRDISRDIFVIVSSLQFVIYFWSDVCRPHHLGSPRENNNIGGDPTSVQANQGYCVWDSTLPQNVHRFSRCEQWFHPVEAVHPNYQCL